MTEQETLTLGYSQRIRDLVAEIVTGADGEDTFIERAASVMSALISEMASCAASLAVTRGIEPDTIATLVAQNFGAMYRERIKTLQGAGATIQ